MKRYIFLFLVTVNGFSQKLGTNIDDFIRDLPVYMATANNSFVTNTTISFLKNYQTLTNAQKEKIANVAGTLNTKYAHKASPHFYFYFEMFNAAIEKEKVASSEIDQLIDVALKVAQTTDNGNTVKWYQTMGQFYTKRQIHTSNFNRLYIKGGKVNVKFLENFDAQASKTISDTLEKQKSVMDDWDVPLDPIAKQSKFVKKALPKLTGSAIVFEGSDLVLATASDSAVINKSSGACTIRDGIISANNGYMNWETAGLKGINVGFSSYSFLIKNPHFICEDAILSYPDRLQDPVKGIFEFKSEKRIKGKPNSFPRFISFDSDAKLKGINQNINYKGGFSLSGKRVFSSSVNDKYAYIVVRRNGKEAFKSTSVQFEMSDSLITANNATYAMKMDQDSITHPSVKLSYDQKKGIVKILKNQNGGFKDTPFFDSYHKLEINADLLNWDMNAERVDIAIVYGKAVIPAIFESIDFFNQSTISDFNSGSGFNPILLVNNYLKKTGQTSFTTLDLFKTTSINEKLLKGGMASLLQKGYVSYNPALEVFKPTKKLNDIILAHTGKKDFDNFLISSLFNTKDSLSNATLNLKDKILKIRGVKAFSLSDSLGVYVFPKDETVNVFQNRNFEVNGNIKAMNFRFAGQKLIFDYDKFDIKLSKIDSITFIPQKVYKAHGTKEIGGHIRFKESGMLYLNVANNKSGRIKKPEFPRLVIPEEVSVFFDQPERKLTYGKEVVFKIPGIDYDSLNVKDAEFVGTFYSGKIFEPFKEKIIVMPDTSLGFLHPVINKDYKVYGTSTIKFDGNLSMDLEGLTSKGTINHLAAKLLTEKILFGSDTITATGKSGEILEGTQNLAYFPKVDIKEFNMLWSNRADSMKISGKSNFQFYDNSTSLKGDLVVRTKGLFGKGQILRKDSEATSNGFQFSKEGFSADTAIFDIKSIIAGTKPVFQGKRINLNFNVLNSFATVSTNTVGTSSIEYPYAAYRTNINRAEWNIKEKKISMKGPVATSIFASTNPIHEGMTFNGGEATYDIAKELLNITGVPFIRSADAKILPLNGTVTVKREGEIQPLTKARLIVDTLNGYHNLINGNIQIQSKTKFFGDATYQYVNVSKDTFNIKMGSFELKEFSANKKKQYSTQAKALIAEKDGVFLSPRVIYRGEMTMNATEKNLFLDGYVKPELKKYKSLGGYWIPYKGNKSENVVIAVSEKLKAEGDEPLVAGLTYRTSGTGLYPSFMSPKETESDEQIFRVSGNFERDETNKQFVIQPAEKPINGLWDANRIEFDDNKNIMQLYGKFEFASEPKLKEALITVGKGVFELDSNKTTINTTLIFNSSIAPEFYRMISEKMVKAKLDNGLKPAIFGDNLDFYKKIAHLLGSKEVDGYRLRSQREYQALNNVSSIFSQGLVLSDLNLKWSEKYNAFYSVGEIGISNIGQNDINIKAKGHVEIRKLTNGEEVSIYLEATPDVWYFISYKTGTVGVFANEIAFNDQVTAKITNKKDKKKNQMEWVVIGPEEKAIFVKTFKDIYLTPKKEIKKPEQKAKTNE